MLTQTLGRERPHAERRVGLTDIAALKGHEPTWLPGPIWDTLVDQWSRPEWIEKSNRAKKIRQTLKEGSIAKYSGGSISFASHEDRLEKELGRLPSKQELFMRTHQKKRSTEFVDAKSRAVSEKYGRLVIEEHGASGTSDQPSFDPNLWVDASGGFTKGRLYGFGGHDYGIESTPYSVHRHKLPSQHRHQLPSHSGRCYTRDDMKDIMKELLQEIDISKQGEGE